VWSLKLILHRGLALWPEIAIIAAIIAAFEPTLLGSAHIPYDAEYYHYPLLRSVQEQLSSGALPVWDAYSYGGVPLLANAQAAWLYPPHLILDGALAVLGRPLTEHALDVLEILHLAVAGLGTSAVARGRQLGRAGAAFAGIFVVLGGATISQAEHLGMIETFAWLPLAILVIDRMREKGVTPRRITMLGTLFALMITAGFLPLIAACAALLIGTSLVYVRPIRTLRGVLVGMVLGLAMAGAMLLPIIAVLSIYPPLEAHGSLPLGPVITTFFPNAFGHWEASLTDFTGSSLTNSYYFVGASVLIILPLALSSGRRVVSDVVLVLGLLLASFATSGAEIAKIIQSTPTVGLLWRPEDVVFVAMIPLALLLARGLQRAPSAQQIALSALVVAMVGILTFSDGHGHHLHFFANAPRRTLVGLLLVAGLVFVAYLLDARKYGGRAVGMALALVAIVAGAELASAVPGRYFVNASGAATDAGPNATGDGSEVLNALRRRLTPDARIAADVTLLPAAWAGFPPIWHLADVNGFQPQFSKFELQRVRATDISFEGSNRTFPIAPRVRPYLEELNAQYVITSAAHDRFAGVAGYREVFQDDIYHVYRLDGNESRAYVVDPSCVHHRGGFEVLTCRTDTSVRAMMTGPATRRLTIKRPSAFPLLLITGEPWYPGWRAVSTDGPLAVRRVGYLAALLVPAGVTQVQLSYHAPGLLAGSLLSILAVGGSLLSLAYWRGRQRDSRH
jgi:hypothetical protein